MRQYLRRRWKYVSTRLPGRFEETLDPKVQLEQAISDAREQHRRLRDQAANVIANQKQTEVRLHRTIEELDRVNDTDRLLILEQEIAGLEALHFQATEAADQAKSAVSQNSATLQARLREHHELLGHLDQAKTRQQVNEAMEALSEEIGQDVPTLDDVRETMKARHARAQAGSGEIRSQLGMGPDDQPA